MQGNDQNDLEWLTGSECRNYIGGRIGEGAYGCVYKFKGHNDLVIKEVDKNNQSSTPLKSYDDELRLLPLLDHPGIIKYKKVLVHNNTIYTIMKKYPDTLSDIIRLHSRDSTTIPERKIFSFAYQIASALEYLHNPCKVCSANERVSCVLHRDLKPNNIMVDDDGEHIVVADFGLCREGFGTASKAVGNRRYQSPETMLRNEHVPESDIWSFGCILYELCTLDTPNFLCDRNPKDVFIEGWKPDLTKIESEIVRKLLQRIFVIDPKDRISAKDLLTMLDILVNNVFAQIDEQDILLRCLEKERDAKHERIKRLECICNDLMIRITTLQEDIEYIKERGYDTVVIENHNPEEVEDYSFAEFTTQPIITLLQAAYSNDINAVKDLIAANNGIGMKDADGKTSLIVAAELGHFEIVQLLVKHESTSSAGNSMTALMYAAQNNHKEVVEILVNYEAKLHTRTGLTALMLAAKAGHPDTVKILMNYEAKMQDSKGLTALMHAAKSNHLPIVKLLSDCEAKIIDEQDQTALMYAAGLGHTEIIKVLLPYEATMRNKGKWTALMSSSSNNHPDAICLLADHESRLTNSLGFTALMLAAQKGHTDVCEKLVAYEKNAKTHDGKTALMLAAGLGHIGVVRVLAEHESGHADNDNRTALMFAAKENHYEAVKLLIPRESGMKDKRGRTALLVAAWNGSLEAVKYLAKYENNITDCNNRSALKTAKYKNHHDVVKFLKGF